MKEYVDQVVPWLERKEKIALARVIKTWGSAPRPVGACMFISETGAMIGSVSGGCVEGAVVRSAQNCLATGTAKVFHFGIADADAWAVGLSCGGQLDVLVQPFEGALLDLLKMPLQEGAALVTNLSTGENFLLPKLNHTQFNNLPITGAVGEAWANRKSTVVEIGSDLYFIHLFAKPSTLLLVGAVHVAAELTKLAPAFGFETIVIEPRRAFAQSTVFNPRPNKILENYPSEVLPGMDLHDHTFAVILSHDPKIDDDALRILLRSSVGYMGALGSKKNHEKRCERLKSEGFSEVELCRIHAPVGVNIGAVGAKEIALSILAEVVGVRNGVGMRFV